MYDTTAHSGGSIGSPRIVELGPSFTALPAAQFTAARSVTPGAMSCPLWYLLKSRGGSRYRPFSQVRETERPKDPVPLRRVNSN